MTRCDADSATHFFTSQQRTTIRAAYCRVKRTDVFIVVFGGVFGGGGGVVVFDEELGENVVGLTQRVKNRWTSTTGATDRQLLLMPYIQTMIQRGDYDDYFTFNQILSPSVELPVKDALVITCHSTCGQCVSVHEIRQRYLL